MHAAYTVLSSMGCFLPHRAHSRLLGGAASIGLEEKRGKDGRNSMDDRDAFESNPFVATITDIF